MRNTFLHGHPSVELDERIYDPAYDLKVCKKGPSIFFGTDVSAYFATEGGYTVMVSGCNTGACIRATSIDAFSHRYRTLVPEDCVGDIEEQPHWDNLRDLGRRYVDAVDLKTVLTYLENWHRSSAAAVA